MTIKNNFGFTLVELLVVIAIIGILSTVAVVNLSFARNEAKSTSAKYLGASLRAAVIFCDSMSVQLNNPMSGSVYIGGPMCGSLDVDWPSADEMPQDYEELQVTDLSPGDGEWKYIFKDSDNILPPISCLSDLGCILP